MRQAARRLPTHALIDRGSLTKDLTECQNEWPSAISRRAVEHLRCVCGPALQGKPQSDSPTAADEVRNWTPAGSALRKAAEVAQSAARCKSEANLRHAQLRARGGPSSARRSSQCQEGPQRAIRLDCECRVEGQNLATRSARPAHRNPRVEYARYFRLDLRTARW